ncbi:hypothetical protein [Marinimicrobium agarilyticum]|uniref:hypothetical protein n=1 Tax=Marinimicrobium agarilyticum TaxID=306546 RepID=UPI0004279DFD|nr:hypothetical protein [Marinimicrobium agarilyticum]
MNVMKKRILAGVAIIGISGLAYASSGDGCEGASRLTDNLNLDEARAYEVEQILSSYKQVKELAMSGQHEQIPVFIEEKNTQLSEVLTEKEMQQFKENVGEWTEGKDFSKYQKFSGMDVGAHE